MLRTCWGRIRFAAVLETEMKMSKATRIWLVIGVAVGGVLITTTRHHVGGEALPTMPAFYVISSDARAAAVSADNKAVSSIRQFPELRSVDHIYSNPFGNSFLVFSPNLKSDSGQKEQ